MDKYMVLIEYARPVYHKCELCKRVKDVHYRLDVTSPSAGGVLIALLLILRIESKLDSLTDAMLRLSEAIKQPTKGQM